MDQDIKQRWVAELRSGNYEQTKGTLKRRLDSGKYAYCCLGVLCELAVADGIIDPAVRFSETPNWSPEDQARVEDGSAEEPRQMAYEDTEIYDPEAKTTQFEVLPRVVMRWAGLTEVNPLITRVNDDPDDDTEYDHDEAASLNDDMGYDFDMIATAIEEDGEL